MRFPLMVDLKEKRIKIFGGGAVALRKALSLKDYCDYITVIAPVIKKELEFANCIRREASVQDLIDIDLAIICTDDRELNKKLAISCKDKGILYLLADDEKLSEVIFPSHFNSGGLSFSCSTGGSYPLLAKKIKKEIQAKYEKYDAEYLSLLKDFRKTVIQKNLDRDLLREALEWNKDKLKEEIRGHE